LMSENVTSTVATLTLGSVSGGFAIDTAFGSFDALRSFLRFRTASFVHDLHDELNPSLCPPCFVNSTPSLLTLQVTQVL
jgi:hypothetical protein